MRFKRVGLIGVSWYGSVGCYYGYGTGILEFQEASDNFSGWVISFSIAPSMES